MSDINLNLYRIFYGTAKSKSYAEASTKLNISISAISRSITNLEKLLNTQLFFRENDGVKLTEAGRILFEQVNKGLTAFDFGEKILAQKNDISNAEIIIGCPSHLTTYYLLDIIEKAKSDYPNLRLKIISCADSYKLIQLLQDREVNLVIVDTLPNNITSNYSIKELKTINNIFISKTPLTIEKIEELENLKYILNFEYTNTTKKLMECLNKHNVKINPDVVSDITEVRVEAVKRNLGIGYVMKEAVKKELENQEVYEVNLPIELPKMQINLVSIEEQLTNVDKIFIKKYLLTGNV